MDAGGQEGAGFLIHRDRATLASWLIHYELYLEIPKGTEVLGLSRLVLLVAP